MNIIVDNRVINLAENLLGKSNKLIPVNIKDFPILPYDNNVNIALAEWWYSKMVDHDADAIVVKDKDIGEYVSEYGVTVISLI